MRVGAAARDGLVDGFAQCRLVIRMHGRDDLGERDSLTAESRIETESARESIVDGKPVGGQIPVPRADDRAGRQRELYPLRIGTRVHLALGKRGLFFGETALDKDTGRRLRRDVEDRGYASVFVAQWRKENN